MKWAEMLMIKTTNQGEQQNVVSCYYTWLADRITNNVAARQNRAGAALRDGLERSRIRRLPISMWSVIRSRRAENVAQVFCGNPHPVCSVPQTIRSIAGRWTTITAFARVFFAQVGPQGRRRLSGSDRV